MTSSTESDKIDLILQVDADCGVLIETLWNVKSGEGLGNSERAEWLFLGIYGN